MCVNGKNCLRIGFNPCYLCEKEKIFDEKALKWLSSFIFFNHFCNQYFKISFLSSFIERSSCHVESKMQKFFNRIEAEMKSFFFIFYFFFLSSRQTSPDKGRKLFFMEFKFCCRGERKKMKIK